jgi:hypothetical protein
MVRRGLHRFPPEIQDLLINPIVVRGNDQAIQGRRPKGSFIYMLDHGLSADVGQDLSGKPGGTVSCGDNPVNLHPRSFHP